MMPTFPRSSLSFRTAGFPQYGWKTGFPRGAFLDRRQLKHLEAGRIKYAIRLPANRVLQNRIGYLLKRPVGRPPGEVRRYYANFTYQAVSWSKPRRVIAKVKWHPDELYPRVGFIVTNLSRPSRPGRRLLQ
jgi:hypothetical protein